MMNKETQQINKGMVKNTNPLFNQDGTYPFALNAMLGSREGDAGTITNEEGNEPCFSTIEGHIQIGAVNLNNGNTVIFSTDNTTSVISLQDACKCTVKTLIISNCLNFKTYHQIDAKARVIRGCESIIYFTDNYNSYRSINIDKLDAYLNPGYTVASANADPANGWNCIKFNHFPSFEIPSLNVEEVYDTGGRLKPGSYQFAVRYLDVNLNPTNWIYITNPVTIIQDSYGMDYDSIAGSKPYTEADQNYTKKSIQLDLTSLDASYKYYEVAIIECSTGISQITNVYISDRQLFNGNNDSFIYRGFDAVNYRMTTIDELNIDSIYINTVEAHNQVDDRLLLANVTTYEYDWAAVQRACLLNKATWSIKNIADDKLNIKTDTKYATYTFDKKSFLTDEVYAFGLVLIFKNGLKSPVFHLPGRKANVDYIGNDITTQVLANPVLNQHHRGNGVVNEWDTKLLTVVPDGYFTDVDNQVPATCVEHIPDFEFVNCPINPTRTAPTNTSVSFNKAIVGLNTELTFNGMSAGDSAWVRVQYTDIISPLNYYDQYHYITDAANVITIPKLISGRAFISVDYSNNNGTSGHTTIASEFVGTGPFFVNLRNTTMKHIGCQIERWKVYNTAVNLSSGRLMGYHQSQFSEYNEVNDCSGVSIWDATSIGGDDLTGTKIRHHRFPDLSLAGVQLSFNSNKQLMSIQFDLSDVYANLPQEVIDNLQGYYIVRADRQEFDKTVVDKGYMIANVVIPNETISYKAEQTDTFTGGYLLNGTPVAMPIGNFPDNDVELSFSEYYSNNVIYNSEIKRSDYIKLERSYAMYNTIRNNSEWYYSAPDNFRAYMTSDLTTPGSAGFTAGIPFQNGFNRSTNNELIVPYNVRAGMSSFFPGLGISNENGKQTLGLLYTKRKLKPPMLTGPTIIDRFKTHADTKINAINDYQFLTTRGANSMYYVSLKNYKDVYTNLNSIKYVRTHNDMLTFIPTSYNKQINDGDIMITYMSYVKAYGKRTGSGDDDIAAGLNHAVFVVESNINSALRHSEKNNDRFYPKYLSEFQFFDIYSQYNKDLQGVANTSDVLTFGEFLYSYNLDYSKINKENIYFPLDDTFDYCSSCNNRKPFTIFYSEKSTVDDTFDNYKIILANNYTTIAGNTGPITNLFKEKDQLYIHTDRSLWVQRTRPQEIQTNEDTLYIGTGSFLSIPPQRLVSVDYGYAGSNEKFATISTQQGTFFIDSQAGKVFMFNSEGLNEISLLGMEQWFFDNLPLQLKLQFYLLTNIKYPVRHTVDKNSIGFVSAFEPRHNRILLHKRDYKILNGKFGGLLDILNPLPNPNAVYYEIVNADYIRWYYYDEVTKKYVETNLDDYRFFENLSWTISYNIQLKAWVSFHSYQPNFMYNDRDYLYSSVAGFVSSVWRHGSRNYCTYYGFKYDHILELIINHSAALEKYFSTVQFNSEVYKYLNDEQRFVNVDNITFDRFIASNNYQMSGERQLIVKTPNSYTDVTLPLTDTLIDRTDNYWRFNRFRDVAVNRSLHNTGLFTKDWSLRQAYYVNGQGYIDFVVNPAAIDTNKNLYTQARFKEKYMYLRLFFKPALDYKIITELVTTTIKQSMR